MINRSITFAFLAIALFTAHRAVCQKDTKKSDFHVPAGFDIPAAMRSLFGNYEPKTDSSRYNIPQSTIYSLKGSSFEIGDDILVRPLWASTAIEDGKRKVVFLTYAVPTKESGSPVDFGCHACTPLIGAAIFVKDGGQWEVESSRAVAMRGGGFGYPPNIFQIIYIGPHRIGIEVINYYTGQGETSEGIAILIPWKGKINEALIAMRSDENSDGCGKDADNFPCYSNKTTMALVPGENSEYFDIVLKRSGTDVTDHEPYKAKPIHGYERLSLADGYYKIVQQAGVSASIDPK